MTNFEYIKSLTETDLSEFLVTLSSAKNNYGRYTYYDPIIKGEVENKNIAISHFVKWLGNNV